jgi:triosephosphate isomerase
MTNRRKIVAGNWKMNNNTHQATALLEDIIAKYDKSTKTEIIICPPFAFIQNLGFRLDEGDISQIRLGAQNCSEHAHGAYTGEVSAQMLESIGCDYVIVGHSERRTYFKETDEQLTQKIKLVFDNNMVPIFCIGEKLEERTDGKHFDVIKEQLLSALGRFTSVNLQHLILAYEPVWAIGTGITATAAQAQEMHAFIRKTMGELFDVKFAGSMPILYGGSCNAQNAKELFACADVDGGLIGGASLKAEDFCKIISSF